jgi:hypothetical protein
MASNNNTLDDGNGNDSDWIELYNNGDESVDLAGYSLTDDAAALNKWQFPSTVLNPGEFLVVFASSDNTPDQAGNLHTNFSLSAAGEYLALTDPSGTILSEFDAGGNLYPEQTNDQSYGLAFTSNDTNSVTPNSSSRYRIPSNDSEDSTWTANSFDDSSWTSGTASIGYDTNTDYDSLIQTPVPAGTLSVYVRIPFTVSSDNPVLSDLQMKYDDGFIAYINGTRVASSNAPTIGSYDSNATGEHPDAFAVNYESFDVSQFSNLLVPGTNTLAIHMLNRSSGSSDFLAVPNMILGSGQPLDPPLVGQLSTPTPGTPNTNLQASDVSLSRVGGAFSGSFVLTMTSGDPSESIRYTTDGSQPNANSTLYTNPISVTSTTQYRARTFGAEGQIGDISTETYTRMAGATASFSSDLPVVVLENFAQGVPGGSFEDGAFALYEPDEVTGRTSLTDEATLTSRIGMQRRGSSTFGNPKTNYRIELRDQNGEDESHEILGMPAESDWILYAPYTFDRALMRNTFIYDMSDQMGNYAIRTRYVEVYSNTNNGTLDDADYMGVYVLMESVKRDSNRVDIDELSPFDTSGEELTGGYIIKIDRPDGAPDGAWHTSRGTPSQYNENSYVHYEPERAEMTQEQVDYIRDYFEEFEDALYGPNSADPELGYQAYFDVDTSIDHHILRTLSKDPDALRLSEYVYKDKGGKLTFGPRWDFDRSMGPDSDGRANNPVGWDANEAPFFGYDWWGQLFDDPNFTQKWVDRWQELRETTLSNQGITDTIDGLASQIAESQARNFDRWSNVGPNGGTYAAPGLSGWEAEVSHLKNWIITRAEWMDSQVVSSPIFNPTPGNVSIGTEVTISVPPETTVYYTLDGTDPRADGGEIAAGAIPYTAPITVNQTTVLNIRANGSAGSTGGSSNSSYPANENPNDGIDGNPNTKYLNFGEENSGIIITPNFGESTVRSFKLTTANDAVERDPASYELYGTNDTIQSRDNSTGLGETWTLIDSGALNMPNARRTDANVVPVSNSTSYRSYKLVFPTVKNASSANSMQVADIRFYESTNGNGTQILSGNDAALAIHLDENFTTDGLSEWSQLVTGVYSIETPANASNLRLTELHYHPAEPSNAELALAPGTADNDYEFAELVNFGNNSISLNGVQFIDGIGFDFTTGNVTSIAPGEAVVIVEDLVAFEARYGAGQPVAGTFSGNLGNGGEQIIVTDADGNEVHNFVYDDVAPWPTLVDGAGPTLQIINPFGDYSDPLNWQRSPLTHGSPGFYETPSNDGDFDGDGDLDCADINALNADAASGTNSPQYDVTGDGVVDLADVQHWIVSLRGTLMGDANLDGSVDVSDFNIWNSNKFQASTDWCSGDFTANGSVDVSDFNVWNNNKFQLAMRTFYENGRENLERESQSSHGTLQSLPNEPRTDEYEVLPSAAPPFQSRYVDNYFAHVRREVREVRPVRVFELGDLGL